MPIIKQDPPWSDTGGGRCQDLRLLDLAITQATRGMVKRGKIERGTNQQASSRLSEALTQQVPNFAVKNSENSNLLLAGARAHLRVINFQRGPIMLRFSTVTGCLAACLSVPVAFAEEPLRLAPSSNWHVNYADDSCRLARSYGTGEEEVVLILDRFRPGPKVNMTLVGRPVDVRSDVRKVMLRFGPNDAEFEKRFAPGTLDNGKAALVVGGSLWITGYDPTEAALEDDGTPREAKPIDPALYSAIRFLEVRISGKRPIILETGPMLAPEQALTACNDDLLRAWGIDAKADKTLSRRVIPASDPREWMRSSDYPPRMRSLGYQGLVHFRLVVDDRGMPKSCHIQLSTRPKDFDDAVCKKIMARARFEPALDAEGKPVASYYTNSARFSIPTS